MQRRLAIIGVAAFVLVDAVLIGFAVRHDDAGSQDPVVIVTRVVVATSNPPSTATSAGGLPDGAADHSPTTRSSSDPATGATPSSLAAGNTSRPGSSRTSTVSTSTDTSSGRPGTSSGEHILLDMSSDGAVIRATTGDCNAPDSTAAVEVSTNGGLAWTTVGQVRQVMRVSARADGDIWFVGADASCTVGMYEAPNYQTPVPIAGEGAWNLVTIGGKKEMVGAPVGIVDTGCPLQALAPVDARVAYVLCDNGSIRTTPDGGADWKQTSAVLGAVSISFSNVDTGFALASQPDCPATLLATADGGEHWSTRDCLEGAVPQAVAVAGERLLAMVDGDLQKSEDAGVSWRPVG